MQSERATGTLSVENGENDCALYFLFGHLFHASGPRGQGEDVVVDALGWGQGTFRFDPRAKLPAEETIKASPADLIAEAQQRQPDAHQGGEGDSQPAVDSGFQPDAGDGDGFGAAPSAASAVPEGQGETQADEVGELSAAPSYSPPWDEGGQPDPTPAYSAWSQPAAGSPAAETLTWPAPREAEPEQTYQPQSADAWTEPAAPAGDGASTSGPPGSAGGETYGRRATDAPPLAELYPLPSGKAVYEGLKSAFVDFPKLLRTLRADTHTGYVRLTAGEFTGVLIFHDGHLLEALAKTHTAKQGESAFKDVQARMERGEGVLDVIDLPGDTVVALAQLLMARPMFTGLMGRFINFTSLVEYLSEEQIDGSVIVATDEDTGVILLRRGEVLGAYTQAQAKMDVKTDGVQKLAGERSARIEVKGGMGDMSGIDVEAVLNRPY